MTKIIIAGDFCPNERVAKLIDNHQFSEVFGNVKTTIQLNISLQIPVIFFKRLNKLLNLAVKAIPSNGKL